MGKPKSTHCRYCHQALGDDNHRGAHRKCFNNKPQFDASIPGAREEHNRRKAIQRRMRDHGITRQEAEAHYDAATGPCECGAEKARNAKYCVACARLHATKRSAKWMAKHRELERMRDRVRHRMKNGYTLEQAQAMESTRGVCGCGKPSRRKNGRICDDCYRAKDREAHVGKPRLFDKTCAECNAPFRGSSRAKYCERHGRGVVAGKTRGYSGKKPKAQLPANWYKPTPAKREKQDQPTPKISTDDFERRVRELKQVEAKNIAEAMRKIEAQRASRQWFRRIDTGEFDPAKVRAVAEILRRR